MDLAHIRAVTLDLLEKPVTRSVLTSSFPDRERIVRPWHQ